jgi:hypothetical protein
MLSFEHQYGARIHKHRCWPKCPGAVAHVCVSVIPGILLCVPQGEPGGRTHGTLHGSPRRDDHHPRVHLSVIARRCRLSRQGVVCGGAARPLGGWVRDRWLGKEAISLSPPPRRTGRASRLAPGSSNGPKIQGLRWHTGGPVLQGYVYPTGYPTFPLDKPSSPRHFDQSPGHVSTLSGWV